MNRLNKVYFLLFSLMLNPYLFAQEKLVEFNDLYPEEIRRAGFTLSTEQNIVIEGAVISSRRNYHNYHFSSAWILDADSRDLVWKLSRNDRHRKDRYISTFETEIELKPGTYEVYYSTYPDFKREHDIYFNWSSKGFFPGIFNILLDDDRDREKFKYFDDLCDQLYLYVRGTGITLNEDEIEQRQSAFKEEVFVSFTALKDDEYREQIFKVTQPVGLNVYALGEAREDGEYDFGKIINLRTRERVWELTYHMSEHAGGAAKNRLSREIIDLEPGIYKALYVTDDTHYYRHWNSAPPYDPSYWGMTLWVAGENEQTALVKLDSENELNESTVIKLNRVGDDESLLQGMTIKKPLDVHIYALGEGDDDDMYDYGWVVDAGTREVVWTMDYSDTEPAGGSHKNRMFDGIVHFEPGNYMVYYITDGSHSYQSWNTSPPYDRENWGITVSVIDGDYQDGDITPYDEKDDAAIFARLVRVGNFERKKASFLVTEDGPVSVYAIGEGSNRRMYDYAWIENENTGKIVWKMTYRKTDYAGGARKNRVFDDKVYLEAGEYFVFYQSDDSHSFNDWNDRPPRDPFNWGVTISKVD